MIPYNTRWCGWGQVVWEEVPLHYLMIALFAAFREGNIMRAYQITVLSPDCLSYFNIRYIKHKRWHYIFISYHIWAIQLKARRFNKYFWLIIYFKTFTMLGFTSYLHESFVFCNTILFGDTLRRFITIEIIFWFSCS